MKKNHSKEQVKPALVDLLKYSTIIINKKSAKSYKYILANYMLNSLIDAIEYIDFAMISENFENKYKCISEAYFRVQVYNFYLNISYNLHFITFKQYKYANELFSKSNKYIKTYGIATKRLIGSRVMN